MQITAKAIVKPVYLNASSTFERWHTHNWRKCWDYFLALGGNANNVNEYVEFSRCQFDQCQLSPRDQDILQDAIDESRRIQVENDRYCAGLTC